VLPEEVGAEELASPASRVAFHTVHPSPRPVGAYRVKRPQWSERGFAPELVLRSNWSAIVAEVSSVTSVPRDASWSTCCAASAWRGFPSALSCGVRPALFVLRRPGEWMHIGEPRASQLTRSVGAGHLVPHCCVRAIMLEAERRCPTAIAGCPRPASAAAHAPSRCRRSGRAVD
jgi:hypothetical protein